VNNTDSRAAREQNAFGGWSSAKAFKGKEMFLGPTAYGSVSGDELMPLAF